MTQAFFGAGEHGLVVAGLDVDHAIGGEADLRDRRREEIGTRQAPKDLARRARGDTGDKKRCGRPVDRAVAAPGNFVKGTELETTIRQACVNFRHSEGHRGSAPKPATLQATYLSAEVLDDDWAGQEAKLGRCMFLICSPATAEESTC